MSDTKPKTTVSEPDRQARTIRRLLILNQVSTAMQSTLELERLLHIILSGITAGEGLGFNRAILFLLSEDGTRLEGRMGVGPINVEECRHIWTAIFSEELHLEDFLRRFDRVKAYRHSELNQRTRQLTIPLEASAGILAQTVLEKRSFLIEDAGKDPRVNPAIRDLLQTKSFATTPLIVGGEALGVMVVDNRFTQRPIEPDDQQLLSLMANQAAVGIQNARQVARIRRFNEELEEKVRQATAELLKKERLAFLGEMAAIVAHEIRNPLTSIKGFSQRIKRKAPGDETVAGYADIIMEEVDRLDAVIADVLDFARRAEPKWQPVNLGEVIRQTVDLLGAAVEQPRVALSVEISPALPLFRGDPAQLKQVLLNVCQNALQAMPEGGALGIEAACKDDRIYVSIHDTGQGIPPEVQEKLFQPFFTTRTQGTGLGLALAQHVVEDHGGRISVESEVGQGTTFTIELPVNSEPALSGERHPEPVPSCECQQDHLRAGSG